MTIPTAPPSPTPPPPAPHGSDRFFLWVAGLGIARSDGWLGGVCAGIAARLRIDPLIVRGILLVALLFGLPVVFLYAVAWALLPDADGRIHARDLVHGRFEAAQLGILALVILAFLPIANPFWWLGGSWGLFYGAGPVSVLFLLIGLAVAIALLVLIVRAARRTPGAQAPDPLKASADPAGPGTSATDGDSGIASTADGRGRDASLITEPVIAASTPADPPAPPSAPADAGDLNAWRAQHAAWREQDQAWRRQQQDADRAAREQARRERQAVAAQFAAEASERRRAKRASNPRISGAYLAAVTGLALVTGAVVALFADRSAAVALALCTAALILALGMVIAGVARRRSGFLTFLTVITLVGGAIAGGFTTIGDVVMGDSGMNNSQATTVRQPFGSMSIYLMPLDGGERNPVTLYKGDGYTSIEVPLGVTLELDAAVQDATVNWTVLTTAQDGTVEATDGGVWTGTQRADGTRLIQRTRASGPDSERPDAPSTIAPVRLQQQSGIIDITFNEQAEEKSE
ncbi:MULTISPECIES: PspC domain-containing protein [unclassified Microbacterium]|uniref:PspC domain-containing protein n=1 Tax=unclassified Microbacterium TaxID=2609290 RepID=UPI0012FB1C0A|nr:PspC domain-containing protein [Microbacterium sp. MAH-37]